MQSGGSAVHGDYLFGRKGDSLQRAMDNHCSVNGDCPCAGLHAQKPEVYSACTKAQQAPEQVDGCESRAPSFFSSPCILVTLASPALPSSRAGLASLPVGGMPMGAKKARAFAG